MSRSYKKTPVCKDGRSGRFGKKMANRKVRRYKGEIKDGNSYRKRYESWDIHDYVSYYPEHRHRLEREEEQQARLNGYSSPYPYRLSSVISKEKWLMRFRRK